MVHLWFTLTGCLLLLVILDYNRVFSLHCHRKHDHSADILLRGDSNSWSNRENKFLHAGEMQVAASASHAVESASPDTFFSAKLIQADQQHSETIKRSNGKSFQRPGIGFEVTNHKSSKSSLVSFCPDRCTCSITSPDNSLQVSINQYNFCQCCMTS
jgi:hypothetical protein